VTAAVDKRLVAPPPPPANPEKLPEPLLATLLRMFVYVLAAGVFAWPLTVPESALAAACAAGIASVIGRALAATRLRTWIVALGSVVALAVSLWLADALVASAAFASAVGPAVALRLGEVVAFGLGALTIGTGVRAASSRHRNAALLEAAFVAIGFGTLVVAHRHGAIHRPFEIADWFFERGSDPSIAVLGVGAIAGIVIGLLLLSERRAWRTLLHLFFVLALLLLVFTLGVTGVVGVEPQVAPLENGEGEGGSSSGQPGELPMQDDYQPSPEPLAIVVFHDEYSPPTGIYYFREEAYSEYNSHRLVRATIAGVDDDVAPGFPTTRMISIAHAPDAGAFRTTVETTIGMLAQHTRPLALESPIALMPITNPNPAHFRRAYRARSASLTGDVWSLVDVPVGDSTWSPSTLAHYTHGPSDPRYAELAQRIVADLPASLQQSRYAHVLAITDYLATNGIYSLHSRHASAVDPAGDFLFGDMTGYCVHFAQAAVFLMRSIGLPARVATGYMVPESARRGGSALLLMSSASHAWPEVYLEGVGWVVVDIAPERSLDAAPPPPDEDLQQLLAELLRGETPLPTDGSDAPQPLDEMARDIARPLARGLLALVVALVVLGYAIKIGRRLAPALAGDALLARHAYRAALDVLGEGGIRRVTGESREGFADRMRERIPSLGPLTDAHAAQAYASRTKPRSGDVRDAARRVRRERAKQVPLWRRLIGLADPYSWWWTK
jgi:transglutaminase-like putative cysteine protease